MTLVPLYDLTQQFNNKNGAVLVGGRLYVYYVGRTELATTWADEDAAAQNTNPVLLDNNGRAPVFVDDSYSYTLVVCDRAGTELFSQDITPGGAGSVGGRIVYHDETLSGAGTVSSLLGVVNIPLGVDETMTAYTGVAEGKDALILGVNGDWFNETFSGQFDEKVDWETFSACCSAVKGGLENKLDASAINNYYTKTEVDGRTSSFVNYNFLSGNYYNKFETSSREELYSAFLSAGQGGGEGSCPWISGGKEIAEAQTLTSNMLFQALSSFTLSGDHNHFISMKGGIYRFPNEWELASGIAITNYFMPQSSFDLFYSGAYQPAINDLYNSANFNTTNKLDVSSFANISGTFLTSHQDISNKLDVTAFSDVSGYFLQADDITGKQDKLTFNYTTANEISGINDSAIYSQGGEGGDCPWISGDKIIEDTQLLTANMIIQSLSSFTVSGDKNHFISVKGGKYKFPDQWQLASAIDETYWFAKASALSSYTPLSAYTPTIGDLYTSANWMMTNKLDASAYTGVQVETAYLPLSSLGDSVGSGNVNVGQRCYAFGTDNDVLGINDFVAGSANTAGADRNTVIFGECNIGNKNVFVLGSGNIGFSNSLVLGQSCSSNGYALSIGESADSTWYSVGVGSSVYSNDYSLAVGRYASADYMAMAIGSYNSACYNSLAVGTQNTAEGYSMIAGDTNNGYMSIIAGGTNTGLSGSVVVGSNNGSGECSLVIGNWNEGHTSGISIGTSNTGDLHSVIVGNNNKVGWKSMAIGNGLMLDKWSNGIAIGKYNKTSAACFVVGNGDADDDRRDLVVIDDNGIVSATNIVTPGGISLVDFYNAFTAYTANHQ